jgi:hypothetical protein
LRLRAGVFISISAIAAFSVFSSSADSAPHRYWPKFPRPNVVYVPVAPTSSDAAATLESLAGLAARETLTRGGNEMIWVRSPLEEKWFQPMIERTEAHVDSSSELWELVRHFEAKGVVKGYVLYKADATEGDGSHSEKENSSNSAATSLCAMCDAVAVSESLENEAKKAGLHRIIDAREITDEQCLFQFREQFDRNSISFQTPRNGAICSESIASGAFTASALGSVFDKALARLKIDAPVLGSGVEDVYSTARIASEWGRHLALSNKLVNLPLLSTETPGDAYPVERLRMDDSRSIWDLSWDDDAHYATFIVRGGESLQWMIGDFFEDPDELFWRNSERGKIPIGWSVCYADLAQLCPYALERLFNDAKSTDDFVFADAFCVPDVFGSNRPETNAMQLHARHMSGYMRMGGLRALILTSDKWDSEAALAAYAKYAREAPELCGAFAVSNDQSMSLNGEVKWIPRKTTPESMPVFSARFVMSKEEDTKDIANKLNDAQSSESAKKDGDFSCVVVDAFPSINDNDDKGGADKKNCGIAQVKACVDALKPNVKVLTPTEFLILAHLRLKSEETLGALLDSLEKKAHDASRDHRKTSEELGFVTSALIDARTKYKEKKYCACFNSMKEAYAKLDPHRGGGGRNDP